ncbi:MAG TPA: SMC-Scp complex subunit ScpB [Nitrospinaceae bacterium]|nr:SMC-Scp complex subunit ScpB [Nitrospinaceae bacterium]MDP7108738.1 SMC-Scp complex subunit ScpB [Nitrospinaceae bacterium]HJL72578.1 SMC-Scp complex subunit ScpB [Nitrospinaceae bacterium]HJN99807.1 SMC-Scp complex subunit ScpB [Nitrospinaceae bacterium]
MEREEIKAIIENILLAADQPVNEDQLQSLLADGTEKAVLKSILDELIDEYQSRNLQVLQVAEGYQLCTRHDYSDWVRKFLKLDKTAKLTQPSLDTLSIIAYKQPLTRTEVEEIRGVDSSGVMRTLLEKKVISPGGRKKVPGRPIMYRTTRKFLEYFGLRDLSDLPTLEDFKESELEDQVSQNQTALPFGESPSESLDEEDSVTESDAESETQPTEPADPDSSTVS